MMSETDVKEFSDIMYKVGQIEGYADYTNETWVLDNCKCIQAYIKKMFIENYFEQSEDVDSETKQLK